MGPTRREIVRWGLATLAALPLSPGAVEAAIAPEEEPLPDLRTFEDRPETDLWPAVRRHFRLDPGVIYLNNGSLGPSPLRVLRDLFAWARELSGNPSEKMWGALGRRLEEVRAKAAAVLGVSADEVALTHNTTEGIGTVGLGLELKPGDRVITTDQEHPGGAGVWRFLETRGIRRDPVAIQVPGEDRDRFADLFSERIERALTRRTRVLALPHVTFGTGHVLPLARMADLGRRRRLLLCVDGAHPPGMMPVDLAAIGCDSYASSSHKWLLAPPGTGLLAVRGELRERLVPRVFTGTGFTGNTARRFDDFGTRNLSEVLAQGSAIDFHLLLGPERVGRRIQDLSERVRQGLSLLDRVSLLTPLAPGASAGMTTFRVERIPHSRILEGLSRRAHFVLRAVPELDAIRVSTGIYNTFEEIDVFLGALEETLREAASEGL